MQSFYLSYLLYETKTKAMKVNFTDNYQFHTRLQLKNLHVEIVDKILILGTIITNKIFWNENCENIVKKQMQECNCLERSEVLAPLFLSWCSSGKYSAEEYWNICV